MKRLNIIEKKNFNYRFDPNECNKCPGYCCKGASGYIWVCQPEIESISAFLKMNLFDFMDKYLVRKDNRFSLKEQLIDDEFSCIFFAGKCTIYEVRPKQCREYPFWDYYKDKIEEIQSECPGIQVKDGHRERDKIKD